MPLSAEAQSADLVALHSDFDRGTLFLDSGGARPVIGFLVADEESTSPFEKGTRKTNTRLGLQSPEEYQAGTRIYQIVGGQHTGTYEITSPAGMDGETTYSLRNVHNIT